MIWFGSSKAYKTAKYKKKLSTFLSGYFISTVNTKLTIKNKYEEDGKALNVHLRWTLQILTK